MSVLLGVVLDGYLMKGQFPLERIIEGLVYASNQVSGLKFVAVMLASSVVYGTLLQVSARHYRRERV